MAIISPPGTFAGPCEGPCDDLCCEHDRWLANQECLLCPGLIGYGTDFTLTMAPSGADARVLLAHDACIYRLRALVTPNDLVMAVFS